MVEELLPRLSRESLISFHTVQCFQEGEGRKAVFMLGGGRFVRSDEASQSKLRVDACQWRLPLTGQTFRDAASYDKELMLTLGIIDK